MESYYTEDKDIYEALRAFIHRKNIYAEVSGCYKGWYFHFGTLSNTEEEYINGWLKKHIKEDGEYIPETEGEILAEFIANNLEYCPIPTYDAIGIENCCGWNGGGCADCIFRNARCID